MKYLVIILAFVSSCTTVETHLDRGDLRKAGAFCHREGKSSQRACFHKVAKKSEAMGDMVRARLYYSFARDTQGDRRCTAALARAQEAKKKYAKAAALYGEAHAFADQKRVVMILAEAALKRGRHREAIALLQKAGAHQRIRELFLEKGESALRARDYEAAVRYFMKAGMAPAKMYPKIAMGALLHGQLHEGERYFRKAGLAPEKFNEILGYAALHNDKPQTALYYFKKTPIAKKHYFKLLGEHQLNKGRHREAVRYLKQAGISASAIYLTMAKSQEERGKHFFAAQNYERAKHPQKALLLYLKTLQSGTHKQKIDALLRIWTLSPVSFRKILKNYKNPDLKRAMAFFKKKLQKRPYTVFIADLGWEGYIGADGLFALAHIPSRRFSARDTLKGALGKKRVRITRRKSTNKKIAQVRYACDRSIVEKATKSGKYDIVVESYTYYFEYTKSAPGGRTTYSGLVPLRLRIDTVIRVHIPALGISRILARHVHHKETGQPHKNKEKSRARAQTAREWRVELVKLRKDVVTYIKENLK